MSAAERAWDILIDGASRGNPGRAAAGVRITDPDGIVLFEEGRLLGTATNNQAEYQALLMGMREALALRARRVRVRTDSQLLVRQIRGEYRVKNRALQDLHGAVQRLAESFEVFEIVWVDRGETLGADALAKGALRRSPPGVAGKRRAPAHRTPEPD